MPKNISIVEINKAISASLRGGMSSTMLMSPFGTWIKMECTLALSVKNLVDHIQWG